jgi:S-DNA-T family DNA segregation ATPase FtsK/SpoIIIE
VVWLVFVVLLMIAGALVWAVRSGRLPEGLRRPLSWWLDLEEGPAWSTPPVDVARDAVTAMPQLDAPAAQLTAVTSAPAPAVQPARGQPHTTAEARALPEIKLDDVAQHLQERRYRSHAVVRPMADPALPVLDEQAIRDNLKRRVPRPAKGVSDDLPLPVISTDEVELNLQQLAGRERVVRPASAAPLPMIDTDEVRASLQQIHGSRLKQRAQRPTASAPLSSPPSQSVVRPTSPPSPLLKSSLPAQDQAVFVSAPVSRAVPPKIQPLAAVVTSLPPIFEAVEPVETVQPVARVVLERVPAPLIQPAPVPLRPVLQSEPVVVEEPAPECVVAPAATQPTSLAATPSLIWHSIEELSVMENLPVAENLAEEDAPSLSTPSVAQPPVPPAVLTPRPVYDRSCLPSLDLLTPPDLNQETCPEEILLERGIVIEEKLAEFKVKVSVVDAYAGPVITRFEVEPAVGVRGSQVVNLIKDLARALGLASIRVVETIPGKTCMGLELPNPVRQMIRLSEIFSSEEFNDPSPKLTLALGKDITGAPVVMDLARAPHLLVAGTTGSGKSVGVNAMILSLLYRFTPDDVRFIMIDPKMLELSVYNDIPHLLAPVVTDMKLAANALNWCVGEMEKRYRLMSALGVRNLAGYNEKVSQALAAGTALRNPFSLTPEDPEPLQTLPAIVVVVDEFADLMMVAGKKIEELIARLAQKARAAGLHLILATQRPSVDVITGLIKANIPTRIAFQVSSKVDSRTILDQMGAEALLGQGDMLYLPPGSGYPQRIHGAFVADDEVHKVVQVLKQFGAPDYVDGLLTGESELDEEAGNGPASSAGGESDPLYDDAVEIVLRTRRASISSVQRHLRIGYNRAARLIEEMEAAGLVSSMESNGSRSVLVPAREG